MTCWHRGTAIQFEVMKDHPQGQPVLTELGTDVVLVTMAARIVQSMISLGRNLWQKRALEWKLHPRICMSRVLRAAVWVCWSVVDLLLPLLMTTVYVYKNQSRVRAVCDTKQPMNTVTIKCHWGSRTEPDETMIDELCKLKMEMVQEVAKMEVDCECEQMARMKGMIDEQMVPSCMNPVILSMICVPSEQEDSSESDMGSVKDLEGDGSQEETSVDSGMQESWTPKSMNDEESDWSDDDSWDEESHLSNEDADLWASFCRSDDPYNPLSFAMPTRSPDQIKKETPTKSPETKVGANLDCTKVLKIDCGTVTEKQKIKFSKKPVLSGYKSSHKCTVLKEEAGEDDDQCAKKVRFSPKVTVHPIITWSFAHRMARKGPWEEYARDRSRFQRRIMETEAAIGFCLEPRHREKIWARLQRKQN